MSKSCLWLNGTNIPTDASINFKSKEVLKVCYNGTEVWPVEAKNKVVTVTFTKQNAYKSFGQLPQASINGYTNIENRASWKVSLSDSIGEKLVVKMNYSDGTYRKFSNTATSWSISHKYICQTASRVFTGFSVEPIDGYDFVVSTVVNDCVLANIIYIDYGEVATVPTYLDGVRGKLALAYNYRSSASATINADSLDVSITNEEYPIDEVVLSGGTTSTISFLMVMPTDVNPGY